MTYPCRAGMATRAMAIANTIPPCIIFAFSIIQPMMGVSNRRVFHALREKSYLV